MMGPLLSLERDPDSPGNGRKRRPPEARSTHELNVAALPYGTIPSDQRPAGALIHAAKRERGSSPSRGVSGDLMELHHRRKEARCLAAPLGGRTS